MKKLLIPTLAIASMFTSALPVHAQSRWLLDDWPWGPRIEMSVPVPALNFAEKPKEYIVTAELPGMRKEDIKVSIDNGMLTISGEKKQTNGEQDAKYRMQESAYGSFTRSISLPRDADPNQVKAEFKDGVLILTIVRNEALQPKAIQIK